MKLKFNKDEAAQISVFQVEDGKEKDFSYVNMIKNLIKSKKMEEPEMLGNFTEAEQKSIKDMVMFINKEVGSAEESEAEDIDEMFH